MKKTPLGSILRMTLALVFGLVTPAKAQLNLDFKLVNKTSYDLKKVYIGPPSSDDWGDNDLSERMGDGSTLDLTFSPKATATKWDIKCVYTDGETAEWKGCKLTDISKITLFWSKEKGSTARRNEPG